MSSLAAERARKSVLGNFSATIAPAGVVARQTSDIPPRLSRASMCTPLLSVVPGVTSCW
jgi:hypothetical protein